MALVGEETELASIADKWDIGLGLFEGAYSFYESSTTEYKYK